MSNKFWLIVLGGIVLVSAIFALVSGRTSAKYAHIYVGGERYATVRLDIVPENDTIIIDESTLNSDSKRGNANTTSSDSASGYNVIEIEIGRIRISEANCPDGLCVRRSRVSGGLLPIVCLPNQVVITFEGGEAETDIDAIVG